MSIVTKKVTMTDAAWGTIERMLKHEYSYCSDERDRPLFIDVSDAITALAEAEVVVVDNAYSEDKWLRDATAEGRG